MRQIAVAVLLVVVSQAGPPPARQLTADDYARAERFLGPSTAPLVSGTMGVPNWLPDGRLWYRATRPGGTAEFVLLDPARRTKGTVFDHAKLGAALASASSAKVDATRLPFQSFDLSRDGREITVTVENRRWICSIEGYSCRAAGTTQPAGAKFSAPPGSVTSPDGRYAAYIRDFNLWMKDLTTDQDRALTTDGVKDFGYATNNAGWMQERRAGAAVVARLEADRDVPARRARRQRHVPRAHERRHADARGVEVPAAAATTRSSGSNGSSSTSSTKQVMRLLMPPDQHRSTVCDHVVCGGRFCDVQWYPGRLASRVRLVVARPQGGVAPRGRCRHRRSATRCSTRTSTTQFESGDGVGRRTGACCRRSNEFIWWSQRDNWGHLYLYDLRDRRARSDQITTGDGNVADSAARRREERARSTSSGVGRETGRDPVFPASLPRRLRRQGPDAADAGGRRTTRVTLSPAGEYFVDTWSTPDDAAGQRRCATPTASWLVDARERADISRLVASGWKPPTPIT